MEQVLLVETVLAYASEGDHGSLWVRWWLTWWSTQHLQKTRVLKKVLKEYRVLLDLLDHVWR